MLKTVLFFRLVHESFVSAIDSLISNKLRTFLSLMGITIGIFAIISVFTAIDALENSIRNSIGKLGSNVVYVQKWPWSFGSDYPWWKYMKRPIPTLEENEEISTRSQLADACSFGVGLSKTVQYKGNYSKNVQITAYTHDYEKIRNFEFEKGRYFTALESHSGKNCVILGYEVAQNLFENENPIGKQVKIGNNKVNVIGVFKKEGEDMFDISTDKQAFIPLNFAKTLIDIRKESSGGFIIVKAKQNISNEQLIDELQGIMRSIRRLKPAEDDNFALNKSSLIADGFQSIFKIIDLAGLIIGGFSILVGGFGIANIMFVSVKEQTRFIGIQKALGAKNYFILFQFLYEAVILSLIGGAIGLLLTFLGTLAINSVTEMGFSLSLKNIAFGAGISIGVGIIAGFLPARTASLLNPVEAMSTV